MALVGNGRVAIDRFDAAAPDIVILDVEMPELDGLETIRQIQQNHNPSTGGLQTILLLSSSDHADLYSKCDEFGVKFRLTKPVKSDELYSYLCSISQPTQINGKASEITPSARQKKNRG